MKYLKWFMLANVSAINLFFKTQKGISISLNREFTVLALENSEIICINKQDLDVLLTELQLQEHQSKIEFIRKLDCFKSISATIVEKLLSNIS